MTNTTLLIKVFLFLVIFHGLALFVSIIYGTGKITAHETSYMTDYTDEISSQANTLSETGETRDLTEKSKLTDQTYGNAYQVTQGIWNIVENFRLGRLDLLLGTETPLETMLVAMFYTFTAIFDMVCIFVMIQAFKKS